MNSRVNIISNGNKVDINIESERNKKKIFRFIVGMSLIISLIYILFYWSFKYQKVVSPGTFIAFIWLMVIFYPLFKGFISQVCENEYIKISNGEMIIKSNFTSYKIDRKKVKKIFSSSEDLILFNALEHNRYIFYYDRGRISLNILNKKNKLRKIRFGKCLDKDDTKKIISAIKHI